MTHWMGRDGGLHCVPAEDELQDFVYDFEVHAHKVSVAVFFTGLTGGVMILVMIGWWLFG